MKFTHRSVGPRKGTGTVYPKKRRRQKKKKEGGDYVDLPPLPVSAEKPVPQLKRTLADHMPEELLAVRNDTEHVDEP